jgi:hypothetical protein
LQALLRGGVKQHKVPFFEAENEAKSLAGDAAIFISLQAKVLAGL